MKTASLVSNVRHSDVLLGRGAGPNDHPGNVIYRSFIKDRAEDYTRTTVRGAKTKIAACIIKLVHDRDGRFLRRLERDEMQTVQDKPHLYVMDDRDRVLKAAAIVAKSPSSKDAGLPSEMGHRENAVYAVITQQHTLIQKTKQAIRHMIRGAKQHQQQQAVHHDDHSGAHNLEPERATNPCATPTGRSLAVDRTVSTPLSSIAGFRGLSSPLSASPLSKAMSPMHPSLHRPFTAEASLSLPSGMPLGKTLSAATASPSSAIPSHLSSLVRQLGMKRQSLASAAMMASNATHELAHTNTTCTTSSQHKSLVSMMIQNRLSQQQQQRMSSLPTPTLRPLGLGLPSTRSRSVSHVSPALGLQHPTSLPNLHNTRANILNEHLTAVPQRQSLPMASSSRLNWLHDLGSEQERAMERRRLVLELLAADRIAQSTLF